MVTDATNFATFRLATKVCLVIGLVNSVCEARTTLIHSPTTFTSIPTSHTNTFIDLHCCPSQGWCLHSDIICAVTPHASFPPSSSPSRPLSHSHLCLAVGHKVRLCGEEVLTVAVASGAVKLVGLKHGALRPLVPVGLPPAHRLSPVPGLQP